MVIGETGALTIECFWVKRKIKRVFRDVSCYGIFSLESWRVPRTTGGGIVWGGESPNDGFLLALFP